MTSESLAQTIEQLASNARTQARELLAQQVISAVEDLARSELLAARIGDVSVRLPDADGVLITPLAPFVGKLTVNDLVEVVGARILRKQGHPTFSMQMHLAIYKRRLDVHAIVHSHAPMSTVLGICELPIPPVTVDAVPFVDLPRVPAPVTPDSQWVQEVAARLADGAPAALLLNHGFVAVAANLQQVVRRALAMEETARILVISYLLRQVPVALPPQAVEVLRDALL